MFQVLLVFILHGVTVEMKDRLSFPPVSLAPPSGRASNSRINGNLKIDEKNYALGGQAFTAWPVALSLTATSISAITIMGAPSETYVYGSTMCWGLIGDVMGCAFAAFVFIPLYWSLGVTSVNEYIDLRFGKVARLVLTIISIIQALIYNGLVVYGPGRVLIGQGSHPIRVPCNENPNKPLQ